MDGWVRWVVRLITISVAGWLDGGIDGGREGWDGMGGGGYFYKSPLHQVLKAATLVAVTDGDFVSSFHVNVGFELEECWLVFVGAVFVLRLPRCSPTNPFEDYGMMTSSFGDHVPHVSTNKRKVDYDRPKHTHTHT